MGVLAGAKFRENSTPTWPTSARPPKIAWKAGDLCLVHADAVQRALTSGLLPNLETSIPIASKYLGVIKKHGVGASWIVDVQNVGEVSTGPKWLEKAVVHAELDDPEISDGFDYELSSDDSEAEDEVYGKRDISVEAWKGVHVTKCQRIADGYREPTPGRLKSRELNDVDPAGAPYISLLLKVYT